MNIGILGTGTVGQTLAVRLVELGHDVVIGTRDVAATLARTQPDPMGNPPFGVWQQSHTQVGLATLIEAAAHGELVLNATNGLGALNALHEAGAANLAGKPLVDVSNPLDFSRGFPPSLFVKDTDSLGEQIQRAFPAAYVVKALNTVTARVMVAPQSVANGDHTMFVCGNDDGAKATIVALLRSFGWSDIIDLGDITGARAMEMVLPVWLRLMGVLQTPMFNVKVVR
jgi:predicted dinucleotide-binding enzyme